MALNDDHMENDAKFDREEWLWCIHCLRVFQYAEHRLVWSTDFGESSEQPTFSEENMDAGRTASTGEMVEACHYDDCSGLIPWDVIRWTDFVGSNPDFPVIPMKGVEYSQSANLKIEQTVELDHWGTRTHKFLAPHIARGSSSVRIASGFFTVQGFDLLRDAIGDKQVRILVGFDDKSRDRLKEAQIEFIKEQLRSWDVANRREAVLALLRKLQAAEVEIGQRLSPGLLEAGIRRGDHSKIYIVDERTVMVGSSNLTQGGLTVNQEAMLGEISSQRARRWATWFDQFWNDDKTLLLTDDLRRALEKWLGLSKPFDVYLKTIGALVTDEAIAPPRVDYKLPANFQRVVIGRVLRQLEQWRGAMVVASTGLGKTLIATDTAYRLRERKDPKIRNVIVFAPQAVTESWKQYLTSAGLAHEVFTLSLLDQPLRDSKGRVRPAVARIEQALQLVDDHYMIIVDECHKLANRLRSTRSKNGQSLSRLAFDRLERTIRSGKPYVLLLTGSPYSKHHSDVNNQLRLLPHTAPKKDWLSGGQLVMPGVPESKNLENRSLGKVWYVDEGPRFFEDFMELPVTTAITTARVARDFTVTKERGDCVILPDGQEMFIPRIRLVRVRARIPFEADLMEAIRKGYFRHEMMKIPLRGGGWRRATDTIERLARVAWMSSPRALFDAVEKTRRSKHNVNFIYDEDARKEGLEPLRRKLSTMLGGRKRRPRYDHDNKLMELSRQLNGFRAEKRKVVIFVEMRLTALYLEEALKHLIPGLKVESLVTAQNGRVGLKNKAEVKTIIERFAPVANPLKGGRTRGRPEWIDVLIATDAYSAGINLQDASVAISYDLQWTADPIIQRAGRVLRMWKDPREVILTVFMPLMEMRGEFDGEIAAVDRRVSMLKERTTEAERFSEIPVMPKDKEEEQFTSLGDLAATSIPADMMVSVDDLGIVQSEQLEDFGRVSPLFRHLSVYEKHVEHSQSLDDDLISALEYDGKDPCLYLLLRVHGKFRWTVYNLARRKFWDVKEDQLLGMLACDPDTQVAGIGEDDIEEQAQKCRLLWCRRHKIDDPEEVERVCAMYLHPKRLIPGNEWMDAMFETE